MTAPEAPKVGQPEAPKVLVIACGALARELLTITRANDLSNVTIDCLPARFHNEPQKITGAVRERILAARGHYDEIFIGYADCGTGGLLDALCVEQDVQRLAGSHCYEFFAGHDAFAALHDDQPGTFYLTDYLARHFDRLVIKMLGLDRHPELLVDYFGNYTRLVYLAQSDNPDLDERAQRGAKRLGLEYERRSTGFGELEPAILHVGRRGGQP